MITNGYEVNVKFVTDQVVDIQYEYENLHFVTFLNDKEYIDKYRRGKCYYFALALHYELGYQIVGVMGRWKKAGHVMARGPNELLYDIGGGYEAQYWVDFYDKWTRNDIHDQSLVDISEPDLIRMLNHNLHNEIDYTWENYKQEEIENAIAIIRAYPKIYNQTARNVAIGRHY